MTQENVETVRSAYEAISRGDWDAQNRISSWSHPTNPRTGPVRGVHEAKAWFTDQQQMVGNLSIEVEELVEAGQSIALIRLRIRPDGADADFELPERRRPTEVVQD